MTSLLCMVARFVEIEAARQPIIALMSMKFCRFTLLFGEGSLFGYHCLKRLEPRPLGLIEIELFDVQHAIV